MEYGSNHSNYLANIFDSKVYKTKVDTTVDQVCIMLEDSKYIFDAIAFSGESGGAIAYPLSYLTELYLICVRKEGTNTHGQALEAGYWQKGYVIVDDQISTGATMRRIIDGVKALRPESMCQGIVLYNSSRNSDYNGIPVIGTLKKVVIY